MIPEPQRIPAADVQPGDIILTDAQETVTVQTIRRDPRNNSRIYYYGAVSYEGTVEYGEVWEWDYEQVTLLSRLVSEEV